MFLAQIGYFILGVVIATIITQLISMAGQKLPSGENWSESQTLVFTGLAILWCYSIWFGRELEPSAIGAIPFGAVLGISLSIWQHAAITAWREKLVKRLNRA